MSKHRVFIDRSELDEGGQPIVIMDDWGRIQRHGKDRWKLPLDAVLRFDPKGIEGPDSKPARVWIEYEGGAL